MGLYRDETGRVIEIADDFADARGYTPITPGEEDDLLSQKATQELGEERGIVGSVNAAATGLASGLTLGGSDYLLGKTLTDSQRRRVLAEIEAHPTLRTGGELAGTFISTLDGFGGTPAGYLNNIAAKQIEKGLARGGIGGTAVALATMGTEGAAQSLGSYVGHTALEDKDLTAEGVTGALGVGFGFGSVAGGAALGVVKGTVAARRMFARAMGGKKAAEDAASAWSLASQEALEADQATMQAAETRLNNIRQAKMEAMRGRNEAKAAAQEASLNARGVRDPKAPIEADFEAGIKTDVRHGMTPEPGGVETKVNTAPDFEAGIPTSKIPRDAVPDFEAGIPTSKIPVEKPLTGEPTSVFKRPGELEGPDPLADVGAQPPGEATSVFKKPEQVATLEVTRDGRKLMHDGREIASADAESLARAQLPEGFTLGELNPRVPFKIGRGVPNPAELKPNSLYVVKPSELAERGVMGNKLKEGGSASIGSAWKEGKKLAPIDVNVTPEGKLFVEDGNHRLLAAAEAGDRPVVINFKKVGSDFKPQAGAVDVSARLRNGTTDLEAQLADTKAKLDGGTALKDIPGENAVPGSPVSPQVPPRGEPPIQPGRKQASNSINDWLAEKAAHDADMADLSRVKKLEDIRGARGETGLDRLRNARQETLSEIRYNATEELLGKQTAKAEQSLAEAVEEYKAARQDLEEHLARAEHDVAEPLMSVDEVRGLGGREAPLASVDELVRADGLPASKLDREGARAFDESLPGPAVREHDRSALDILDSAHEEALLRAKHAVDPAEAGKAVQEAAELEDLLERLAAPQDVGRGAVKWTDDVLAGAAKVERYEKASARLAEEMGDAAHPKSLDATKNLRGAEKDAERKMWERSARATDDADLPPASPKERAQAKAREARQAQIDAQRKYDDLHVQHMEASNDFVAAKRKVREGEKMKKGALREDAKAARAAAGAAKTDVGDIGGLLEVLDIPGIPKPSDLPIVGPLLGAYLKFRTLKKSMGKAMGRVPATADAKAAVLASETRDRVARAIDRTLGRVERSATAATTKLPALAGVLSQRIYDDGGEQPKKGASISELAAVRMREVQAYVSTPGAIERDVRIQMRHVTDPDLIAAVELARRNAFGYLASTLPPVPDQSILNHIDYKPSPAEALKFARRLEAINDPAGVFERLGNERMLLSLEAAEALRKVYPRMFGEAQTRLLEQAAAGKLNVPMRQRVQLSLMYNVPLDASLDPDNLKITQSVYDRKPAAAPAPMAGTPPQPSIAQPVNISQAMTTSIDKR